ncbi:hypothetical protein MNEG_5561 [Monoraphidium neglectum]|uniref:Uncharacterized protein n=1 Tax=Monoraphidium neglectum TaxID=145388 RepID=A0A0D2N9U9_9CHLO|nr:hypothetical protein MNEG_5561 [Monoraphidium neglectum]KIZ02396.1 hypothetical protein MNEG_5561 [Monoraphidium neglectum]|eukprot:XP_013901415.1 hypothetical protein MNEG_5561 [Monoraphidium neglectum]
MPQPGRPLSATTTRTANLAPFCQCCCRQAVLVDRLSAVVYECRSLERLISRHEMHMRGTAAGSAKGAAHSRSASASGGASSAGTGVGEDGGEGGLLQGADGSNGAGAGGGSSRHRGGVASSRGRVIDVSEPSEEERARVESVVRAAEDPGYWVAASRDGNRESHYRGNALGATLIHELACFSRGDPTREAGGAAGVDKAYSTALPGILRRFRARVDAALPGMYVWWDEASLHITIRALIP